MNIYIDKSNWEIYKKSSPFPFAEIDNFIIPEVYKKIKLNFPDLNDFEEDGDISANNIQIRKSFYKFSKYKNLFWYEFGNQFVNEDFFYNYCDFFKDDINHFYPKIYKKLKDRNLNIGVSGLDDPKNFDILLDFQIGINTPVIKKKSVRGPHIDNYKELYAGLCYLKDSDDYTDSGHFIVFKKRPFIFNKIGKGRSFDQSNLIEIKKIKYSSNKLSTFLNTKKSIHGVSEREITSKVRKFFVFNSVITNENLINFSLLKKLKKNLLKYIS